MKIIIAGLPVIGHINPLLNVGRLLVEAGHEVVFTTAEAFRERIESNGMRFVAPPPGAAVDLSDANKVFPERLLLPEGPEQTLFSIKKAVCDPIPAQYSGLKSILESFAADLILSDSLFAGGLPFLLREGIDRPAMATLGVTSLMFRRDDHAPVAMGLPVVEPGSAESVAYAELEEQVRQAFAQPVRNHVDEILRGLGANSIPMDLFDSLTALPDLYLHPGSLRTEVPRKNLPASVHTVGVLPPFTRGSLPQEVLALLGKGKKLVVVTQGTVSNHELDLLVKPTIDVLANREDVVVVGTTGGRPLSTLKGQIPGNAFVSEYLPLDSLLEHASVLVTNGGYGTVCRALGLGVPMVVAGIGEDKADVALQVEHAGVGINLRTKQPEHGQLRAAIDRVLDEDTYRQKVKEIAAELQEIPTARLVVDLLEETVAKRQASLQVSMVQ